MSNINTAPVVKIPHANARQAIMTMQIYEPRTLVHSLTSLGTVWDYSFARPPLENTNIVGVCRYLDFLPNGKVISASELAYIFKNGKKVLYNWENGATDMRGGSVTGSVHGKEANRQLDLLQRPHNICIVYSADWDVQPSEYPAIAAYLDAARVFHNGRPVGIYGKNAMVHYMLQNGHADIGWVTIAWLYGQPVSPLAHLFQDGVNSPNGTDHNIVLKANWGADPTNKGVTDLTPEENSMLQTLYDISQDQNETDPTGNKMNNHWQIAFTWGYAKKLLDIMQQMKAEIDTLKSSPVVTSSLVIPTVDEIAVAVVALLEKKLA